MQEDEVSRSNRKGLIIIILAALLVAVGGYFIYAANNTETPVSAISDITPKITTQVVQDILDDKFTPEDISLYKADVAPYWPVEDSAYYVNYTGKDASELDVIFDDTAINSDDEIALQRSDIINTITSSLTSQGFKKVSDTAYGSTSDVYRKDDLLCTVDSLSSTILSSPVSLQCGSEYEYNTDLDSYKKVEEFATAYTSAGHTINKGDIFTIESDVASASEGYRQAKVSLGNINKGGATSLLFYKKTDSNWWFSTNKWQLFTETQSEPTCDQYNSSELKAAFKNNTCYDTVKALESKVE